MKKKLYIGLISIGVILIGIGFFVIRVLPHYQTQRIRTVQKPAKKTYRKLVNIGQPNTDESPTISPDENVVPSDTPTPTQFNVVVLPASQEAMVDSITPTPTASGSMANSNTTQATTPPVSTSPLPRAGGIDQTLILTGVSLLLIGLAFAL